jgi:tRNA A-37 threonylcarbamoyl transferase component Bud32
MKRVHTVSPKTLKNFRKEVTLHTQAGELGVAPKVIDSFIDNKHGYIVMEAISGPDFKSLSAAPGDHKKKAEDALAKIFLLHDNNILHGDLNKLDNIIYDEKKKEPFLIDFGLADRFDDVVARDAAKHTRELTARDMEKKYAFWRGYDTNHLRSKFGI